MPPGAAAQDQQGELAAEFEEEFTTTWRNTDALRRSDYTTEQCSNGPEPEAPARRRPGRGDPPAAPAP